MITKNALKYVYKKATSQSSEEIYKKLKDIDDKYNKIVQKYECTITFKCMKNVSFDSKLSAQSSFGKSIIVSPEWAYTLMSSNNDNVNNAFLITIGHEITHKEVENYFSYTGSVQTFTAPVDGEYTLEVGGAQGGGESDLEGGKGGKSTGKVTLKKGETIYLYVGQSGSNNYGTASGTYNGGGAAGGVFGTAGGGATHIAKTQRAGNIYETTIVTMAEE